MNKVLPKMTIVSEATQALNISYSASGLHGFLCGALCAGQAIDERTFIKNLLVNAKDADDKAIQTIASLYKGSLAQLRSMTFEFQLLIADELPLPERAKALGDWCEGFGEGLSEANIDFQSLTPTEAKDALLHIHEIAEIDYENTSITEEDEKAFFEIFEYVRMAVLMIYGEINQKEGEVKQVKTNKTLH